MTAKRKALTTDDLLRLQEQGSSRKRPRPNAALLDLHDWDTEAIQFASASRDRTQDSGDEDSSYSASSSREDDMENEEDAGEGAVSPHAFLAHPISELDDDSDEGEDVPSGSRVAFMPRKSFQTDRKPLTAPPLKLSSFEAFGISPALLSALSKMSIKTPTEIQASCIPPLLQGEYVAVFARKRTLTLLPCKAEIA